VDNLLTNTGMFSSHCS